MKELIFNDKAIEYDEYCHNHKPQVCGLFGSVFCDFGPEFIVVDTDGYDPHAGIIASIINENPARLFWCDCKIINTF